LCLQLVSAALEWPENQLSQAQEKTTENRNKMKSNLFPGISSTKNTINQINFKSNGIELILLIFTSVCRELKIYQIEENLSNYLKNYRVY